MLAQLVPTALLAVLAALSLPVEGSEPEKPRLPAGVYVLDDCDPVFKDKEKYGDHLTFVGADGKVGFRVGGLNNAETIGSCRLVACDAVHQWIWVIELVGHRIHKFDRAGRELLVIPDIEAHSLAVDEATGNLWVARSDGTIYGNDTLVFSSDGKKLQTHQVAGFDIAYDRGSKSFWLANGSLTRISAATGAVAFEKKITEWCASSIAMDDATGDAWVALRDHPNVAGSANELKCYATDGTLKKTVTLDGVSPFHVATDPLTHTVWVTDMHRAVHCFSREGKLKLRYTCAAIAAQPDPRSLGVWVVTRDDTRLISHSGELRQLVPHASPTGEAWLACFPFTTGAP